MTRHAPKGVPHAAIKKCPQITVYVLALRTARDFKE